MQKPQSTPSATAAAQSQAPRRRNFSDLFASSSVQRANSAITRKANTALTAEQLECVQRLESCVDRVLSCKRRDMYLRTLSHCIANFDDADKDEPLTSESFNVFDCYTVFTQELRYFPEKFDFLIYCILHRVCLITKPRAFHELLEDLLMPPTAALAQRVGGELLGRLIADDGSREEDEMRRVESFTLRKDWAKKKREESGGRDPEMFLH